MEQDQLTIFDYMFPKFKFNKPIRLIEFFAGYGSQALALKYLNIPFESYKICEWNYKSIEAYKQLHFLGDNKDYSKGINKEEIGKILYKKGISSNWNESMSEKQINRLGENKIRKIYNNIMSTHNLVNIEQVKGKDLQIKDTNIYIYIY